MTPKGRGNCRGPRFCKKTPPAPGGAGGVYLSGRIFFPALAGKQKDLSVFCFCTQKPHGGGMAGIVKAYQYIVQHQRCIGRQFPGDGQPKCQIQLVDGAFASPLYTANGGIAFRCGVYGKILL